MVVVAEDHDDDDDDEGLGAVAQRAAGLGLDLVVSVASEDMLERVLEQHDPETFHLADAGIWNALSTCSATCRSGSSRSPRWAT